MQNLMSSDYKPPRILGWWYRLSAPPEVSQEAPLRLREQVRKGKFTSIALLIAILILAPALQIAVTSDRPALIPLTINLIIIFFGILLNRSGKILAAGLIVVLVTEIGMFINILTSALTGGRGLDAYNLILFAVLVEPELFAVSLFPAWAVIPVAFVNSLFIAGCITFLPKVGELARIFPSATFETYFAPISLQVVVAMVSYMWVSSAIQEMKRANQAEEVNKLTQTLSMQQQNVVQEKRQLDERIQQIVAVHMQVANGNFEARVPVDQTNVLWSIAGSLNNLLGRVQRWRQDALQMQTTERALQQVLLEIQQAKRQGFPVQVHRTGTVLDPLIAEFISPLASASGPSKPLGSAYNSTTSSAPGYNPNPSTPLVPPYNPATPPVPLRNSSFSPSSSQNLPILPELFRERQIDNKGSANVWREEEK